MKNSALQDYLKQYPADMDIKFLSSHEKMSKEPVLDFDEENILLTSETAYVDENAPEDEWDCEDGKVELGDGKQYLLINPIII
jgi:hypothetical protein